LEAYLQEFNRAGKKPVSYYGDHVEDVAERVEDPTSYDQTVLDIKITFGGIQR